MKDHLGDMAFWRAEGTYQMWEDLSASGSVKLGATTGAKNKIEAEVGSVTGSLISRDEVLSKSTYLKI